MKNKAINHPKKASVDSLKDSKLKLPNYLAIGGIAAASTMAAVNTANAANVASGITDDDNIATAYVFNIANKTLTISAQNNGTNDVLTIQAAAITDSVAGSIITVTTLATNDSAQTTTIASITLDATAGAMTITDVDNGSGIMTVNVAGVLATDGTVTITTLEDTDDENIVVDLAGAVTVDGAFTMNAGGTGVTGNILVNISIAAVKFNGGVVMNDISITGVTKMTIDGGSATIVAGTIDGAADFEGSLDVSTSSNAAVTFTGNIGETNDLLLVDLDETTIFNGNVSTKAMTIIASHTATFEGDLTLGATKLINSGVADISGTTAQTITGAIEDGLVQNSNTAALVTFEDALGVGTIVDEIQSDASSDTLFKAVIDTTLLDLKGQVTLTQDDNTATELDMAATGTTLIIDDTVLNGQTLFLASTSTADGDIAGTDNIKMPANLLDGEVITFMVIADNDALNAALVIDLETAVKDTALKNYVVTGVTASKKLFITANDKSATQVASNLGVDVNTGKSFVEFAKAITGDATILDTVTNSLNAEGGKTLADATQLAEQAAPQMDSTSGSTVGVRAMTGAVQGIVSNRMASLRSGDAYVTGMSAGNGMSANSGFIQAFGSESEQKNIANAGVTTFGYDTETSGLAIGFDGVTDSGSTVGLSASYSTTDVDGKGTGKSKNSIDSYTVSVYADKATESGYIEGSLTYGINDNTSSRVVNVQGLNRSYTANYDSEQYSLKVGGGVPNEVSDGTFLTPFITATATNINTDAFTESSSVADDSLRLRIEQDDINSLVGSVGVKAHAVTDFGTPMISLAVNNEFGDAQINTQNTYQGGGTKFKTVSDVEELSATLGLGYSFGNDVTSLNLNYEANANEDDYISQYGSVKIVAKF